MPIQVTTTSFNEAPIHESGKYCEGSERETPTNASMRPRFMNRGSKALLSRSAPRIVASMRPRFMNRGSLAFKRCNCVTIFTLQ